MSNGRREPPHGCQAVLHAHFALQSPKLRQIVECVYVAHSPTPGIVHRYPDSSVAQAYLALATTVETQVQLVQMPDELPGLQL